LAIRQTKNHEKLTVQIYTTDDFVFRYVKIDAFETIFMALLVIQTTNEFYQ